MDEMTLTPLRAATTTSFLAALLCTASAAAQPESKDPASGPATAAPTTAVAALDRAHAAYEYGDMAQVVDSARPIVEGALRATPAERLEALRLLGIGLYLIGRPTGAETHFLELLRERPRARLDPTTTRPEVVAFFEDVRRRHAPTIQGARRSFWWNLLPPIGQFKNGDDLRGYAILAVEAVSLGGAIATVIPLNAWRQPDGTYKKKLSDGTFEDRTATARSLRTWNHISVGVLAATWAIGVADAIIRSDREPDERTASESSSLGFFIAPGAAGVLGRF